MAMLSKTSFNFLNTYALVMVVQYHHCMLELVISARLEPLGGKSLRGSGETTLYGMERGADLTPPAVNLTTLHGSLRPYQRSLQITLN
jgi:hypothetical protein